MNMTDEQLLELLNGVIAVARPIGAKDIEVPSLDADVKATGLDSLDFLMVGVYLSDIYGVSEEDLKNMKANTVREMFDYLIAHKTKEPASVEEALDMIR